LDRLCELANLIAMNSLKEGDYDKTERYLKRADKYSRHSPHMLLVTHNNWSCYFKKIKNNTQALLHIQKAIKLAKHIEQCSPEQSTKHIKLLADCYLNLCVILSTFGEHDQALIHAEKAIYYIEEQMDQFKYTHQDEINKIMDRQNVLAIAKFNRAT
jgi:tetratricopeptide (TPR) repeat protein